MTQRNHRDRYRRTGSQSLAARTPVNTCSACHLVSEAHLCSSTCYQIHQPTSLLTEGCYNLLAQCTSLVLVPAHIPVLSWYLSCTDLVLVPAYQVVLTWYQLIYWSCPGTSLPSCIDLVPAYIPVLSWYQLTKLYWPGTSLYTYRSCPGTSLPSCIDLVPPHILVLSWYQLTKLYWPGTSSYTGLVLVPAYQVVLSWYQLIYRSCPGTSLPSCIDLVPAGQVVVVNTYIISIVYIISTIFDVRLCYFLCISMVIRHVIASESMVCDVYLCCCAYLWSVAARRWTTTWTSATRTEFTLTRLKPNVMYVSVCHSSQITRSSRIMFVYFHI